MEIENAHIDWAVLRSVLMETESTKDLLDRLSKKQPLSINEIALLNLLMHDDNLTKSKEIAEQYAYKMADASMTSASATKATSCSTDALKKATRWLAGATIILAASAVADLLFRVLYRI